MNEATTETERADGLVLKSAFFGPLVLLSCILLSLVVAATYSFDYAIGYTAGKLIISITVGLPLFIFIRYARPRWRNRTRIELINLFCLIVVFCWIIQIALLAALPKMMSGLESTSSSRPTVSSQRTLENFGRNQDGSVRWQDFEPLNPAVSAAATSNAKNVDKSNWPICKNPFDSFDPGAKCKREDE